MDGIHAQEARATGGMRLAALPDAHMSRPRLGHRQPPAPVRHRLPKAVQVAVGEPCQALETSIAEDLVLTLHQAPRHRAAQAAQGPVHLSQQTDVRLSCSAGETDASDPAAGPRSAPSPGTERSTARPEPC